MNNKAFITILLAAGSLTVSAQTEGNGKITLSGMDRQMSSKGFTENYTMLGTKPLVLWRSGGLNVRVARDEMLGMMNLETGMVALHQDFGRLHFTATAKANKYWMPMQGALITQYGIGGNVGFDVSDHLSLHAFGYYYSTCPIVGPALSPYVSTTNYGGYADIRFSDRAGSNIGIRRYLNPMSGRWTTEPICSKPLSGVTATIPFDFSHGQVPHHNRSNKKQHRFEEFGKSY